MHSDYHIHSDFSTDSKTPMREYCERALSLGLEEICFTDHVDYDVVNAYTANQTVDYPAYFKAIEDIQAEYAGRLTIKAGMEFGVQVHNAHKYTRDAQTYPFDFILLSSHEIDNQELWLYSYQEGKTQLEYNRGYYANLLKLVQTYDDYSVLGHLDVIKRYDKAGILEDDVCLDLITEILKEVIRKGKGIEVNTSSYRYRMPSLTPSKTILSLYRELGGEILSLGSDAHNLDHLGEHMASVRKQLRELGFTRYCTFTKRQPVFHDL